MRSESDTHKSTGSQTTFPNQWLFYLIAALGILISLVLWYAFVLQANNNLQHIVNIQSKHIANDINEQFELRISALKHLAKHLKNTKLPVSDDWQAESADLLSQFPGIEAIAWLNPKKTKVEWITAQQDHYSKTSYFELIQPYLSQAKPSPVSLSDAFIFGDNQQGMLAFITSPNGNLIALLNLDKILGFSINNNNYSISISHNDREFFHYGNNLSSSMTNVQIVPINVYGSYWQIRLKPSSDLIRAVETHLPFIALMLGIFIAILFAITTRFAHLARQRAISVELINQDLTNEIIERKLAEDTKQKLEKALLQGQKLQAIGTLAGGIAHDFNNILYAVMGYAEMAQDDVEKNSIVHKNLGKVLEASKRGQELIARILMFSRRQAYEFKLISLKDTLVDVLSLLKSTIPASITITFNVNTNTETLISGNATHLHQVIMNMVNNSADAMNGEGEIKIELSKILAIDPLLQQLPNIPVVSYYRIDISDSGHGMDQTTVERIFEPFFTTKEVGKGTGLGLATAHAIIKEHQGDILVNSELGKGTTFTLLIPVYINKEQVNG